MIKKRVIIAPVLTLALITLIAAQWIENVRAGYQWDNQFGATWNLSEKASTVDLKEQYLNQLYTGLKNTKLASNDAYFFPTTDNSSAQNLQILGNLLQRMDQIKAMDPNSYEYQTALQQITGQQMGDAAVSLLQDTWIKANYPLAYLMGYGSISGVIITAEVMLAFLIFIFDMLVLMKAQLPGDPDPVKQQVPQIPNFK